MGSKQTTTMIIPAAGYGTRVGRPPAKELLLRPGTTEPMIEAPIRWASERQWQVLVITRFDKKPLRDYLQKLPNSINLHLIESSPDWQSTILQGKAFWSEKNILVLPDTEFYPINALDHISQKLEEADVVAGNHKVTDASQWGHIWSVSEGSFFVVEKPIRPIPTTLSAWGILGFRKSHGEDLLNAQWESQKNKRHQLVSGRFSSVTLESFSDLTR